jgi:hypothetical protein
MSIVSVFKRISHQNKVNFNHINRIRGKGSKLEPKTISNKMYYENVDEKI